MSESKRYGSFQEMYSVIRNGVKTIELEKATKKSKGVKVKLIDAIDQDQHFNLPIKNESGNTVYRSIKFRPGVLYKAPTNDAAFLSALKLRGKVKKKYTAELEKSLKDAGVEHRVVQCRSCGGGLRKIELQLFEVIGE